MGGCKYCTEYEDLPEESKLVVDIIKDPYSCGVNITKSRTVEFYPGLTVLLGCNGAGKTTLIKNIQEVCKKKDIPVHLFDNLTTGRNSFLDRFCSGVFAESNDLQLGILAANSSEGETIRLNMARQASMLNKFLSTGYTNDDFKNPFATEEHKSKYVGCKIRVLLFDAIDSGLSIDQVIELKELFAMMKDQALNSDKDLYIIVSANEYELGCGQDCVDVISGRHLTYQTYPKFEKIILGSRKKKDDRIKRMDEWKKKTAEKERTSFYKLKDKFIIDLNRYKELNSTDRFRCYSDRMKFIRRIDRLRDFSRRCKAADFGDELEELRDLIGALREYN